MSVIPATAESDRQQNDNLESQVCTQTHFLNIISESLCYLALPVLKNCSILTRTKFYCPRVLTDSNWCIPIRGGDAGVILKQCYLHRLRTLSHVCAE